MAKVNANEQEFYKLYDSVGLNPDQEYKKAMFDVIFPYIGDIRHMLDQDNKKNSIHFQEMEWRLSMVVANRSRHNIMVPKFTTKFQFEKGNGELETVIADSDYNNMKRLQEELTEALASLNGRYSRKVMKFLKWFLKAAHFFLISRSIKKIKSN